MKKNLFSFLIFFAAWTLSGCMKDDVPVDYRGEMRSFVEEISRRGRTLRPGFIVIPQNGLELLTASGLPTGQPDDSYLRAIDGVGQEELFYGYDNHDDQLTPEPWHTQWLEMCRFARNHGRQVLVTDYAASPAARLDASARCQAEQFRSFVADHRDLDDIPADPAPLADTLDIDSLSQAQSFLYLITPDPFGSKEQFIDRLSQAPEDVLLIDLFFNGEQLTASDLARLRVKPQGGTRKLICYMSIGEAESYRWYWRQSWFAAQPDFIVGEDPGWVDNYYVRYWDPAWQEIICGYTDSYLSRVINTGFDGVYLDLVNAYEYFEE